MPTPRVKPGHYPAVLSYAFRPFFLCGALYAAAVILIWLPVFYGALETHSHFSPIDWHLHEVLFGYAAAIIAGFFLTATPNWTGRLPVQGLPLFLLLLLWVIGRLAVFFSAEIGWITAALLDCLFLAILTLSAAIEIVISRKWRNGKMLVPVIILLFANIGFHLESGLWGASDYGRRAALAAVLLLIMVVGGGIIPSFTRNWLMRENPGRLPAPSGRFDRLAILVAVLAMGAWVLWENSPLSGGLLLIAAGLHFWRLARWAGDRSLHEPLVLILHIAYFFLPLGLLLAGLAIIWPSHVPMVAAIHSLGVGMIGTMTLAVMTRATLSHTGRLPHADRWTLLIYGLIILSALTRIGAAFTLGGHLLYASALLWALAFLGYALCYGSMLISPRLGRRKSNIAT